MRLSRAALLVPLVLVACNTTTSSENGNGDGSGAAAGSSTQSAGSSAGGSMSDGGTLGSIPTSGAGGSGASAGTPPLTGGTTASAGSTSAGGDGAGGEEPVTPNPAFLVNAHFSERQVGPYAREDVALDFGAEAPWDNGLGEGRATIEEEDGNRFLRVTYVGNVYGPADGGVQFVVDLGGDYEELFFAYRLRFQADFAFNMGGKLPGFGGGTNPTGCAPDEGGFSARNMWRGGGALVQYVYWPDQPNTCGDDLYYDSGGGDLLLTPGSWQTIEHRVRMNTPGQNDGVLEGWVDGQLALSDTARQWRKTDTFAIDIVYFSTFFGGGSQPWASPKEQFADFDDLIVSSEPITH